MSSVQTVTSEKSGNRGFAGAIGALGRRLSGTFIGTKPHAIHGSGKDKRPAIYTYDEESGQLRIGGISVTELADQYQTPLYIYDVNRIADNFQQYQRSLQSSVMNDNFTIAYGVKVNELRQLLLCNCLFFSLFFRLKQRDELRGIHSVHPFAIIILFFVAHHLDPGWRKIVEWK